MAEWAQTLRCNDCQKERPVFLMTGPRCRLCQRQVLNRNNRRYRRNQKERYRAFERQRYHAMDPAERRCRDALKKVRQRTPKQVPPGTTVQSLLPVYNHAHALDLKYPEYEHRVCHIYRLRGAKVCGLHTLKNLRIVRYRRVTASA